MGPGMKRVLIVEDDPDIGELITHYLEAEGFRVDAQADGEVLRDVRGEGDLLGVGRYLGIDEHVYTARTETDCILYALGVRAGVDELQFTTENTPDTPLQALPTMAVVLSVGGFGCGSPVGVGSMYGGAASAVRTLGSR